MILLCTCMTACLLHAQENTVSKGTSCVPVRTTSEEDLAFRSGERMDFILHYKWGSINTDVGTATVSLDSLTFNGQKAFKCTAYSTQGNACDIGNFTLTHFLVCVFQKCKQCKLLAC